MATVNAALHDAATLVDLLGAPSRGSLVDRQLEFVDSAAKEPRLRGRSAAMQLRQTLTLDRKTLVDL